MSRTGPTPTTRALVNERDGNACALCGIWGKGLFPPLRVHHRLPRRMGGTRRTEVNSLSALVLCCAWCDPDGGGRWPTRQDAYDAGWLLHAGADPAQVPLRYRGRMVYLTDEGTVEDAT